MIKKIYNYLTENPKRFTLIFCSLCLFYIVVLKVDSVYKKELLHKDFNYSIGKVISVSYSKRLNSIVFEFNCSNTKIIVEKDGINFHIPQNIKEKQKFITVFSNNDCENSMLLFDYPIMDSTDFYNYVERFKINPPKY